MSREFEILFKIGSHLTSQFTRSFSDATKITGQLGDNVVKLGSMFKGLAAAAGAGFAINEAFSSANDFQKAMNHVAAATGASSDEMRDMQELSKNLYNKNLNDDWESVSKALITTKNVTKLTGSELENATNNALALKDTFEFDVGESVKTADTMMKNFGITSDNAFGLVAQGAQQGLDKSGELLDSANEYSPHFKALGFSANEMFDTFSAGMESGAFNLDKVGDAVKEFNIRAKDGSAGSAEAFQALGMDADKMAQTFAKSGPDAKASFDQVVQAISAIEDPVKKNQIGVQLFGTQFEDLEAGVIAAMGTARSQFDMTQGTMEKIREVRFNTVGEAFKGIGRQLETGLVIPLVQKTLPAFDWLATKIESAMPGIQKFGGSFLSFLAPVGGVLKDIGGWITGMFANDSSASFLNTFKESFLTFGETGKSVVSSVVAGFEKFKPVIEKNVSFIMSTVIPTFGRIAGFIINDVVPHITGAFEKIAPLLTGVFSKFQPILEGVFGVFNFVFPAIASIVTNVVDAIGGVIGGLLTTFGGVIDFVVGVFSGDWGKAWGGVSDIFTGIFSALGSILAAPINFAIDMLNLAIGGLNSVKINVPDWVPGIGGESFGVNIPQIPKIGGYADGGIVSSPEVAWVGEGGDTEVIVPINNSKRSQSLWQTAGSMLGVDMGGGQGGGGSITVHNNPTIVVQGGGPDVQGQVERGLKNNNDDLISKLKQIRQQEARLSYG
ncbi:phage tail tape measure protein [Tumebacillus permanentifrigoris]|uniref:Minor tail protein n=1 Tax=Tumebacillus permanentifrigoris TaxID=378543 RepID=A0A316DCV9_9BACL|nr:phage tail tape measure protein [Tumebacillus permanentifrigoris]PWK16061.1 minor tail protein [Tumebacillus permanentifrigoris]